MTKLNANLITDTFIEQRIKITTQVFDYFYQTESQLNNRELVKAKRFIIHVIQRIRHESEFVRKYMDVVLLSHDLIINLDFSETGGGLTRQTTAMYYPRYHVIKLAITKRNNKLEFHQRYRTIKHEFWHAWVTIYNRHLGHEMKSDKTPIIYPFSIEEVSQAVKFNKTLQLGVKRLYNFFNLASQPKVSTQEAQFVAEGMLALKDYQPSEQEIIISPEESRRYQDVGHIDKDLRINRDKNKSAWNISVCMKTNNPECIRRTLFVKKVEYISSTEVKLVCSFIPDDTQARYFPIALRFEFEGFEGQYLRETYERKTDQEYQWILLYERDASLQELPTHLLTTFFPERQRYHEPKVAASYEHLIEGDGYSKLQKTKPVGSSATIAAALRSTTFYTIASPQKPQDNHLGLPDEFSEQTNIFTLHNFNHGYCIRLINYYFDKILQLLLSYSADVVTSCPSYFHPGLSLWHKKPNSSEAYLVSNHGRTGIPLAHLNCSAYQLPSLR